MSDLLADHRRACDDFSAVVAQGEGRWVNPSPCPDWDARGVVEHVIGFHDELLLRPTGTEPERSEDDPIARWGTTVVAIGTATATGSNDVDLDALLPVLTAEVLVHTWDLAKALGVDPRLDTELCQAACDFYRANEEQVRSSGLFDLAAPVPGDAAAPAQLMAFVGRDPGWTA